MRLSVLLQILNILSIAMSLKLIGQHFEDLKKYNFQFHELASYGEVPGEAFNHQVARQPVQIHEFLQFQGTVFIP